MKSRTCSAALTLSFGIIVTFNFSNVKIALAKEANLQEALKIQSRYEESLERVLNRLHRSVGQNRYGEQLNKSLELTVEGGMQYLAQRDLARAKQLLKEAIDLYRGNALAHLIYADVSALEGHRDVAGRSYLDFWSGAEQEADLLREILDPVDRQIVASHISGRLLLYGMELPDQKDSRDLPLLLNMSFEHPSFLHVIAAYGLPVFVAVGIPFFLYRRYFSFNPSPVVDRILYQIYFLLLVSYFLWISHSLWKVKPFFGTAEWEVLVVLLLGICGVFALQILRRVLEHEHERRDPNTIICPHCGKSVLRLATVCPFCNRNLGR
ncbi:MAG: hypothetical protein A3G87_09395 [Omnitrophica bacterium RIFCSPLOWO2_12_FULL_50_11]|nr:MAG: hypothetical protein A3G87_09395 [Omnitrophica bacterium RIFCSPLOWO2_12_FULL_50_11]